VLENSVCQYAGPREHEFATSVLVGFRPSRGGQSPAPRECVSPGECTRSLGPANVLCQTAFPRVFDFTNRVKSGQEPECRLSGGDCGLMMVLVSAECGPKTSLVCGSECHCLQAASATRGRIGQVSEPTRPGKHRTPVSILPGRRGNPWVSSRQQTQKDSRQPQPKSMPRKVGIELNASEALVEAS
jgi:hypothetical protein